MDLKKIKWLISLSSSCQITDSSCELRLFKYGDTTALKWSLFPAKSWSGFFFSAEPLSKYRRKNQTWPVGRSFVDGAREHRAVRRLPYRDTEIVRGGQWIDSRRARRNREPTLSAISQPEELPARGKPTELVEKQTHLDESANVDNESKTDHRASDRDARPCIKHAVTISASLRRAPSGAETAANAMRPEPA